jgi:hypothetical protein
MSRAEQRITRFPFVAYWLLTAALYALAWRAGFVTDAVDWLYEAQHLSFGDYLNRSRSTVHALYQTTQFSSYGFYLLFGTARLPWFLLFVTMQAGVAWLLCRLCYELFGAGNLKRRRSVAFWGAAAFCASPLLSEVLVWKACFHYLQALLLMLGILLSAERYIYTRDQRLPWLAALLYLVSAFSLELFYLTPLLTATLFFFYQKLGWEMAARRKTWLIFLLPQAGALLLHLLLFRLSYGEWASHGTGTAMAAMGISDYLGKFAKLSFHLLLFGRFWPQGAKDIVYALCEQPLFGYLVFLGIMALLVQWARRSARGFGQAQIGLLLLLWVLLAMAPALLMPFEPLFTLSGNRYLYLPVAFLSMLLAVGLNAAPQHWQRMAIAGLWLSISAVLTLRESRHWQTSERINEKLLGNFSQSEGKTTVLLSMPYCYKGIPMINAWPAGNFARMRDVLLDRPAKAHIYDGMAFNMSSPSDGSKVEHVNDSTLRVTLLQWGTWWWYKDFGGYSYETPDYRIDMRDQGHWYEIVFKKPMSEYRLLYQVGDAWKEFHP